MYCTLLLFVNWVRIVKTISCCPSHCTLGCEIIHTCFIWIHLNFDYFLFSFLFLSQIDICKCIDFKHHHRKAPVRHTLQPLCDLSATDNLHQSQRSQQGPRSVPARLQRSRRLIGDLVATKSVADRFLCLHKTLAATDLVADRSRQSRRPVPDQSTTSRRPIAD